MAFHEPLDAVVRVHQDNPRFVTYHLHFVHHGVGSDDDLVAGAQAIVLRYRDLAELLEIRRAGAEEVEAEKLQ